MPRKFSFSGCLMRITFVLTALMVSIVLIIQGAALANPVFLLRVVVGVSHGAPQYYVVGNSGDIMLYDRNSFSYLPDPISSPDGKWKASVEFDNLRTGLYILPLAEGERLFLGSSAAHIGWSSDSHLLAYYNYPLFITTTVDGKQRRMWSSPHFGNISPSPDGRWFALTLQNSPDENGNPRYQYAIMPFTMDAEPLLIPQLPIQPMMDDMVWSPDSRYLILPSWQDNQADLYWIEPGVDFTPHQLTDTPNSYERNPQWSQDGRYIAFVESFAREQQYKYQMTLIDFTTGQRQSWPSYTSETVLYEDAWSPDGKWLAFKQDSTIMLYETATGQAHQIGDFPQVWSSNLLWSADSNWLAYGCNPPPGDSSIRSGVYALHIPDMQIIYVAKKGGPFDWYPSFEAMMNGE
jgi:WD40 repeat protein